MTDDNVTDIRAHKMADLIIQTWLDSQSDNGWIWKKSNEALEVAKAENSEELLAEAVAIARARWNKMHNVNP
jgi:hypothetical protein